MPRPYTVELRERAVAASDAYGLRRASILFKVGTATLKRWRRRSREVGSLAPSPMGGDHRGGAKTAQAIAAAVDDKPGWECPDCGRRMRLRTVVEGGPAAVTITKSLLRARGPPGPAPGGEDRGAHARA